MMAGNVLGKGYTAGVGMTIGTVFGRIAGAQAAAVGAQRHAACSRLKRLRSRPPARGRRGACRPASTPAEAEVARQHADLQRLPLLRGLLRGVPGDDAPARIRQGRRPLPRQPLPQLRRLPARLPIRAAARVRRQRAAGDGARARARPTSTTPGRTALGALYQRNGPDARRWRWRRDWRCSSRWRWRATARCSRGPLAGNFYAVFPHNLLALLFGAVFAFAALALGIGVARFWREHRAGRRYRRRPPARRRSTCCASNTSTAATATAATTKTTRSRLSRRRFHHLTFYGFMLCFAATCVATLYHYALGRAAPYPLASLPVLLGTAGGIGLLIGPGRPVVAEPAARPAARRPGAGPDGSRLHRAAVDRQP